MVRIDEVWKEREKQRWSGQFCRLFFPLFLFILVCLFPFSLCALDGLLAGFSQSSVVLQGYRSVRPPQCWRESRACMQKCRHMCAHMQMKTIHIHTQRQTHSHTNTHACRISLQGCVLAVTYNTLIHMDTLVQLWSGLLENRHHIQYDCIRLLSQLCRATETQTYTHLFVVPKL